MKKYAAALILMISFTVYGSESIPVVDCYGDGEISYKDLNMKGVDTQNIDTAAVKKEKSKYSRAVDMNRRSPNSPDHFYTNPKTGDLCTGFGSLANCAK